MIIHWTNYQAPRRTFNLGYLIGRIIKNVIPLAEFQAGFQIEIRTTSGDLVRVLKNPLNIAFTQALNEPFSLIFEHPSDDDINSEITFPREIWLRRLSSGDVVRKFRLLYQEDQRR